MVRARALERDKQISIGSGRFKERNTLLSGVALDMGDITGGVYCTVGMLMR